MTFSQRAVEAAAAHVLRELDDRGLLKGVDDDLFSEIGNDVAKAALTAALAVDGVALQGWQPIESAPKDGGYIVTNRKRQVAFCDMQSGCRIIHNVAGFVEWDWDKPATHWQPLPHPPAASDREERK